MIQVALAVACCWMTDWPQFRGPESDGHVAQTSTPLRWSETENVAWKRQIEGLGWSSPVVADGKVFVTTAVEREGGLELVAMALDPETGETRWEKMLRRVEPVPAIHQKNSHASPTPIFRDGALYVHFGTLGTAKLRAEDGEPVWLTTALEYSPVHGSGGSPILADNRLVVVCDGSSQPFVAALDAQTGEIAWKTPRSVEARISHSFVTPMLLEWEGRQQVLAPGPDHFAAYDLVTGEELWRVLAPGWSVVPQPVIGHGLVYYNHDYDHPELMAVRLGGSGDVTESHVQWRLKRGAPSTPTPVLVENELYFVSDDGVVTAVDAKSGEVHWTERLGGNFSASPVYANEAILLLDEEGQATWIRPGKTFEVLATNEVEGRTFATPAFADGAMFLRTDTHLYKIKQ